MSNWYVIGKHLAQSELSVELTYWLNNKVHEGVRLFHEGATVSEFQWGKAEYLSDAKLWDVWLVRLFCTEYELCARRLDYETGGNWQLRIAAQQNHLPPSEFPSRELLARCADDDEIALLLGQARGIEDEFDLRPNRYRRACISYPNGKWQEGIRCGLVTTRFQPPYGGTIVCWKELKSVKLDRRESTKPIQREVTA